MQSNKNFYEGQNIYVGIDVHSRQWHVYASPINKMGIRPVCIPPKAEALLSYLQNTFPGGTYISAYESGFCGYSYHRQLTSMHIENYIFNAADLKKSGKELLRKTDAVDCKMIWENLVKKDVEPIYIPTEDEEAARQLIRTRESLAKDLRRIKQRIKMFHHKTIGCSKPEEFTSHWTKAFIDYLQILADSMDGGNSIYLSTMISNLLLLERQIKNIENEIYKVVSERHPVMSQLLPSVPGIGKLTSAKLCLELMNFERFPDARKLAGYIGLVPDCHVSDRREVILGNSIRGNKILRPAVIEAAWIAIKKDPALGSAYCAACARGQKPNVAIISIARRLVNRIYFVYRTKSKYEICKK